MQNPKLAEIAQSEFAFEQIEPQLADFYACFFCLGVSSAAVSKEEYERITYGITMSAAEALCRLNPQMTFIYVTGVGTDSSETARSNWARVKERTENALMRLPFKAVYMSRPGFIEALHGVRSKTSSCRLIYTMIKPLMRLFFLRFM